jgi:FkbM family methyltransferase
MNRRAFLGGISHSFVVGTVGGMAIGAIGASVILYDARRKVARTSYAQQGEDLIVESIFGHLQIPIRTYLDIGAFDPTISSNTYLFYLKGCRGVLVEPNPALCGTLKRYRPRDTVLNVGIGPSKETAADYYLLGDANGNLDQLNTFSKEEADRVIALGGGRRIRKIIKMPLVSINTVMEEHFQGAADFVSTDTEGLDLDILKSLDFDRFRPPVVCAEAGASSDGIKIIELMRSKGYSVRGSTFVNTIFVDDRLLTASAGVP